jgi:hypothetical protein
MMRVWSVLIVALLVAFAGCGGDDEGDRAAESVPTATARTAATTAATTAPGAPKLTPEAARNRRRIERVQRPIAGQVLGTDRAQAIEGIEAAIALDAVRRQRAGQLRRRPKVQRAECERLREGRRAPVKSGPGELLLECTAVTAEAKSSQMRSRVLLGFGYRAKANLRTGKFAFCSVEVPPAEGGSNITGAVPLSPRCGGGVS